MAAGSRNTSGSLPIPMLFFPFAGPLAQLVEHLPFKQGVAGSNPARLMRIINHLGGSKSPAFFHVHTNVYTGAVWSRFSYILRVLRKAACRVGSVENYFHFLRGVL